MLKMLAILVWGMLGNPSILFANSVLEDDYLYAPQVAPSLVFNIKSQVEVTSSDLILSDIVECRGSRRVCGEIVAVLLMPAPAPGKKLTVTQSQIAEVIRSEWPDVEFQISGAKAVRVERIGRQPEINDIKLALSNAIKGAIPEDLALRIDVDRLSVPAMARHAIAEGHYEFPLLRDALEFDYAFIMQNLTGNKSLQVQFVVDAAKGIVDTFNIQASLAMSRLYLVAASAMQAGHVIEAGDLERLYLVTNNSTNQFIDDEDDLLGKVVKHPIKRGQGITLTQVSSPLLVKRGQLIALTSTRDGVSVQSKGKAMSDGTLGQFIEVRQQGSKRNLRVKVTGEQAGAVSF